MTTLTLIERTPLRLPSEALNEDAARQLWQTFGAQVTVRFPSPQTAGQWELIALDWVGVIPLGPLTIHLAPKIPLASLLTMLTTAYELQPTLLPGLTTAAGGTGLLDLFVAELARGLLHRVRQGLSRVYEPAAERLPYVRGRIDLPRALRSQHPRVVPCRFEQQTADQADNQILAWTLYRSSRLALLQPQTRRLVSQARRALDGISLQPWAPADVAAVYRDSRRYSRLTADYRRLHALCLLILEGCGPFADSGTVHTLPFLINTARLFERFVASWLRAHLPPGLHLQEQERIAISSGAGLHFRADMVLYGALDHRPVCIIDTKYKAGSPSSSDIAQVASYAHARGCRRALLVYPTPLPRPLAAQIGDVTVTGLVFDLAQADLNAAGQALLAQLLES